MALLGPPVGGNNGGSHIQAKGPRGLKKLGLQALSKTVGTEMALVFTAWNYAGEIDYS